MSGKANDGQTSTTSIRLLCPVQMDNPTPYPKSASRPLGEADVGFVILVSVLFAYRSRQSRVSTWQRAAGAIFQGKALALQLLGEYGRAVILLAPPRKDAALTR